MIILIMGGQNSGKSSFAEDLAVESDLLHRYYIATMKVMDKEGETRRERHQQSRRGKGFETLEIPCHIDRAYELMDEPEKSTVLLECVANLAGNIMHEPEWSVQITVDREETVTVLSDHIIKMITQLAASVGQLIAVTYDPKGEADRITDEETKLYLRLLMAVNEELAHIANKVYRL